MLRVSLKVGGLKGPNKGLCRHGVCTYVLGLGPGLTCDGEHNALHVSSSPMQWVNV